MEILKDSSYSSRDTEEMSQEKNQDVHLNISRSPIKCPATSCSKIIGMTSLLSHFILDHNISKSIDFEDILKNQRSVLVFNDDNLIRNENICIGVLAYGGCENTEESRPAAMGLSLPNAFLPPKHNAFVNHLPILIMACKTSIAAFILDARKVNYLFIILLFVRKHKLYFRQIKRNNRVTVLMKLLFFG